MSHRAQSSSEMSRARTQALEGPPTRRTPRARRSRAPRRGVTLVEVVVVLVTLLLLVGILMPAITATRRNPPQSFNGSNLRSIAQGLATIAISNKDWYPGLTSKGEIGSIAQGGAFERFSHIDPAQTERFFVDATEGSGDNPAVRLAILLQAQIVSPEILLNPIEWRDRDDAEEGIGISREHYSYAMLALSGADTDRGATYTPPALQAPAADDDPPSYGRPQARAKAAWTSSDNVDAVILSDRNVGGLGDADADGGPARSLWNKDKDTAWQGHVVRGDGSLDFMNSVAMPRTRYGDHVAFDEQNPASGGDAWDGDHLFFVNDRNNDGKQDHNADAVMVYPAGGDASGNPTLGVVNQK
ncbi:MAG: hypothetical protein AAGA57_09250 [Planctomycetota bacterium]